MLRRIVVGLSGSTCSQAAATAAVVWGKRLSIEVVGLCVVDVERLTAGEAVPLGGSAFKQHRDEARKESAHADADRWLAEFVGACQGEQIACQAIKREGDPASVLVLEAQGADLLLLGRKRVASDQGTTNILEQVLRHATRPVPTVPEGGLMESRPVLVAYDGSPQSAKALQAFQSLGLAAGQAMHVLTVSHHESKLAAAELAADYLRLHGHEVYAHSEISRSQPGEVILAVARRLNVGLIVMGSFGRALAAEWFFGSVTRTVIEGSSVPLFLYH